MTTSAAIYARVSTDIQAEHGYSIETQIAACEKYAQSLGASTIQKYIDDGYSGAYLERPALDSLRDALQMKLYDTVICYTPDRFARKLSHQLLLTEEVENSGASLHFVNGEYKDTPEGRMFYQMQGAFAEYEREKIRERTMRGKRGKLRSGLPIANSHVFGYGFDKETKQFIINPAEAEIVRLVFKLYTEDMVGGTDYVALKLMEMNVPSPKGNPKWQGSNICRMLKKEMYTGEYYANKFYYRKTGAHKRTVTVRPQNEWIRLTCPAIIDKETFETAQHLLSANKKAKSVTKSKHFYLLQGIMKCARCGRSIVILSATSGKYYACISNLRLKQLSTPCKARLAKTQVVDNAFWEMLLKLCSSKDKLEKYIKSTDKGTKSLSVQNNIDAMKKRLEQIDTEKSTLVDWFTQGLLTQEAVSEKLAKLTSEAAKIKQKLSQPSTSEQSAVDVDKVREAILSCPPDEQARRRVIQSIIKSVEYERLDEKGKRGKYKLKFSVYFH